MKINAQMGVDLVAVEGEEELSALIELTAPESPQDDTERTPSTLIVVLDRSGSMGGGRLEGAKRALLSLVDRLSPTDRFGLVSFDDQVRVEVPAATLDDKPAVKAHIEHIRSGGTTNLSAGYLRGLQEARRVAGDEGATVLLISDGHANAGITEPDQLASVSVTYAQQHVTTSTLGYGLGYDERLLTAITKAGRGNEHFAEEPDTAAALISQEVTGLLSQTIQAASLAIRMSPHVRGVRLANDLEVTPVDKGLQVELGNLWAGEERKLVLVFDVPQLPALGLTEIATLELRYVDTVELKEETVTIPLHVNVVPGDEAAGRTVNPVVATEVAFQEAQRAKREASRRLYEGDVAGASMHLAVAASSIGAVMGMASPESRAELSDEAAEIDQMMHEARYGETTRASKRLSSDAARKSRQRGRRDIV
jgi:Ca-activated chloride channel family protein